VTLGVLVALMALIFIVSGFTAEQFPTRPGARAALALITFPGAYQAVLAFVVGLGGLLAVIYGAAIAGSEWTWGTLKNAVARGESRSRYAVTTYASAVVLLAVGMLLAFGLGVAAATIGATVAAVPTSGLTDPTALGELPEKLARGFVGIVEEGAIGFAIATIARSQLAGIGAGIAVYFGEQFSTLFLPDVVKYLPFNAAQAMADISSTAFGGDGGVGVARLEPDVAAIVVAAWLLGALLVAALVTERAEVSG
jgi:hypothetical protein